MDNKVVMYIVVNSDLKMSAGKIAAQVGHVVQLITEEIIRTSYEKKKPPLEYVQYMKWKSSGCAKIVLKAPQAEIEKLMVLPSARHIIDEGRTQVEPGSLTVLGFCPTDKLADQMKSYKLL